MLRNAKTAPGLALLTFSLLIAPRALSAPDSAGQDWPQWRGAHRDGVWKEQGLLSKFPSAEIAARWRVPVGNGYSGPTVANGRVYVTDRITEPKQQERTHCFDWQTGKKLWTHAYDCVYEGISFPDGPRASVTVQDGKAYALGAMGHLFCYDAAKGSVLWSKNLSKDVKIRMPDWGIAASPLIEGDKVIVFVGGSGNASVLAFDRNTGAEKWRALPDGATYSSPIIIPQARKRVLVVWTAERIVGLDPNSGKLHWEHPFPGQKPIGFITTPVVEKDRLFVTAIDGSLMLKLRQDKPAVEKAWLRRSRNARQGEGLMTLMATPVFRGDHLYGIDYFGELRCLDAKTGDRLWENTTIMPRARWASAHLIQQADQTWIFNEKGQLILAQLTPQGYTELSRARLIKPTTGQLNERGGVAWAHPAFAYGHVFARNDEELVCASLKG